MPWMTPQTPRKKRKILRNALVMPETSDAIVRQFLTQTTIQGVTHFNSRQKCSWKIFWFLVIAGGLSMAIYQSNGVMQDYYKQSVAQKSVLRRNQTLIFPSVTFCSNVLVDLDLLNTVEDEELLAFVKSTSDLALNLSSLLEETKYWYLRTALSRLLAKRNATTIAQIRRPALDSVQKCMFRKKNCFQIRRLNQGIFHSFDHLHFGSCFTFNPGFHKRPLISEERNGLRLGFYMKPGINRDHILNGNYAVMVVHPPGSAAILEESRVIKFSYDVDVKVSLSLQILQRLNRGGNDECYDSHKAEEMAKTSAFYSPESPFEYSVQSCRETCRAEQLWRDYLSVLATTPMLPVVNISDILSVCIPETCHLEQFDLQSTCSCLLSCKQLYFNAEVVKSRSWYWQMQDKIAKFQNRTRLRTTTEDAYTATIDVSYKSGLFETIMEERKYTEADFWGIIGGNLNLWVGVCLVSLFELLELLFILLQSFLIRRQDQQILNN